VQGKKLLTIDNKDNQGKRDNLPAMSAYILTGLNANLLEPFGQLLRFNGFQVSPQKR
jgi:hypothetical protein